MRKKVKKKEEGRYTGPKQRKLPMKTISSLSNHYRRELIIEFIFLDHLYVKTFHLGHPSALT